MAKVAAPVAKVAEPVATKVVEKVATKEPTVAAESEPLNAEKKRHSADGQEIETKKGKSAAAGEETGSHTRMGKKKPNPKEKSEFKKFVDPTNPKAGLIGWCFHLIV